MHAFFTNGDYRLSIEVINLSAFPVTITHFGFMLRGTTAHMQFIPDFPGGERLPIRLEARAAVTALLASGAEQTDNFPLVKSAYVKTACGRTVEGRSRALTSFIHNEALARLNRGQ
jgi:hypothetical protein